MWAMCLCKGDGASDAQKIIGKMKKLTISQIFDLIPRGGTTLLPGGVVNQAMVEAERRNRALNGEWFSVTAISNEAHTRVVRFALVTRVEAWDIAREDLIAHNHRFYRANSWQFA